MNMFKEFAEISTIINKNGTDQDALISSLTNHLMERFPEIIKAHLSPLYFLETTNQILRYQVKKNDYFFGFLFLEYNAILTPERNIFFEQIANLLSHQFAIIAQNTKLKSLKSDFKYVRHISARFFEAQTPKQFYNILGNALLEIIPKTHILILSWEPYRQKIQIRGLFSDKIREVINLLGQSPIGMEFPINKEDLKAMKTGRFLRTNKSLSDFVKNVLSDDFVYHIEQAFSIQQIYSISLKSEQALLGNILFLCPTNERIKQYRKILQVIQIAALSMQRFRAETELSNKSSTFETLLNHLPHPVYIENQKGKIIISNQRFQTIFNNAKSAKNLPISKPVLLGDELITSMKNGTFHFQITQTHLQNDNGKYIGSLTLLADITKRRNYEIQLQKQKEQFASLFSYNPYGIIISDKNGKILECNNAQVKILNIPQNRILNSNVESIFLQNYWQIIKEELTQKQMLHKEIEYKLGKDSKLLFITVIAVQADNLYLIHTQNITTLRTQELLLRSAQKMQTIGELAAGITHEINSPVQFISDNIHFIQSSFQDIYAKYHTLLTEDKQLLYYEEEVPKAISQSIKGIKRIQSIVKSMRHLVHPDMGNKILSNLHEIIIDTIILTRHEWKYCTNIEYKLEALSSDIFCVSALISQVLMNIIINAAHAIKERQKSAPELVGELEIRTKNIRDIIRIEIIDNGIGISPLHRDSIFTPFFTTKKPGEGTGQGLPISYTIVKQHGGEISFVSKLNKGTIFRVDLPIAKKT